MRISILLALFALAGCATSTGIVSVGQGVFMIARTQKGTVGSSAPVKARAIQDADEYCHKHGKVMLLMKTVQKDMKPFQSDAYAEVYFKCLEPSEAKNAAQPVEEIRK